MIPSVLTFCSDQALGDRVAETENSSLSLKAQKILWRRLGEGLGAWPFPFEMTLWIKCDSKHAVLCHLLLQEALHIYMQSAFWVTGPASCCVPHLTLALGAVQRWTVCRSVLYLEGLWWPLLLLKLVLAALIYFARKSDCFRYK